VERKLQPWTASRSMPLGSNGVHQQPVASRSCPALLLFGNPAHVVNGRTAHAPMGLWPVQPRTESRRVNHLCSAVA
jgi:hypothetical protein